MYICFANRLHITNSEECFKSPICLCYAFRIFTLRNGLNLDDRSLCGTTNPTLSNRRIHSTKYSLLFTANCVNLYKTILCAFFGRQSVSRKQIGQRSTSTTPMPKRSPCRREVTEKKYVEKFHLAIELWIVKCAKRIKRKRRRMKKYRRNLMCSMNSDLNE